MTDDQLLALWLERKTLLKITSAPITGTPEQLSKLGFHQSRGESYYSQFMRQKEADKSREARLHKKRERAASLQRVLEYKRQTGQP